MTFPYDSNYDPAAILLPVTVTGVVRQRPRVGLPVLIDTGADLTAVPSTAVKRLRLYSVGRIEVEGFQARVTTVDIYTAQLTVANLPIREMEVIATEQPFVILGRDWLEQYYLLLNGPEKTFSLSETPLIESV